MLKGLIEGVIVHYVVKASDVPAEFAHIEGQHRAAIVVNAWPGLNRDDGYANLTVFMDWSNDGNFSTVRQMMDGRNTGKSSLWATSHLNDELTKAPGTWHWIEGSDADPETLQGDHVKINPDGSIEGSNQAIADFWNIVKARADGLIDNAIRSAVKPNALK